MQQRSQQNPQQIPSVFPQLNAADAQLAALLAEEETRQRLKVRLIASAAESPERLYIEGEGSFEFERTAAGCARCRARTGGFSRKPAKATAAPSRSRRRRAAA